MYAVYGVHKGVDSPKNARRKMVAVLTRMFGLSKIDTIMDIVQDTFESALSKWRFSGIPHNPSAWLMQVAKNKALNTFKRENKTKAFSPSLYLHYFESSFEQQFTILLSEKEVQDSQLRLLISCCTPDLSPKHQLIISLNILCGFGIPEIANALLMKEEAVKKSLSRGKEQLRKLDSILKAPIFTPSEEGIRTVQAILYLMFNEGYKTTRTKDAINNDLCFEAIRLAKLLENDQRDLSCETEALLSLMFFHLSRFPARLTSSGEWLTLEEQDRSKWNKAFIEEGFYYLKKATKGNELSRFHLEAIIASLHSSASTFKETDWKKIVFLYHQLETLEPSSPIITLNRIIAESYLPRSNSLKALDELEERTNLKNNFLVPATKGDLYKRKGELQRAQKAYEQALSLAVSPIDKKFLNRKILQCQEKGH